MRPSPPNITYLAIAEVRFHAVQHLAQHINTVQTAFQQANHVQAQVLKNQGVQLEQMGEQQMLLPTVQNHFAFANKDNTRQYILNEQCLVFKMTDFQDIDSFISLFQEGVYIINKMLNIVTSHRMGMRLLKRIIPRPGLRLQDYLQVGDAQLLGRFGGLSGHGQTELAHQFNEVHLLHRVKTHPASGLELPHDIQSNDMAFKSHMITHHGPSIFLDSDAFIERYQDLSLSTVKDNLQKIHAILGLAFQSSVSDMALSDIGFR